MGCGVEEVSCRAVPGPCFARLNRQKEKASQKHAEKSPVSVAERMAPISASDGSLPGERIWSIVTTGQAKHSRPSNSVDQAQISVRVVPRHQKNAAAAIATPA